MFGIGVPELLIIFLILLFLFGGKRLAELGGGLGKALKNFKKATEEPDEIDVTPKSENKKDEEKE